MKLNRASCYALHAVVHMATQKENVPMPSHLIAKAVHVPEKFLLKVLKPLVSAQVLYSVKGPNGGYRLAKAAGDITMLEIVEAVDNPIRGSVPYTEEGDGKLDKKLEVVCNEIAGESRRLLEKTRISDLAKGKK